MLELRLQPYVRTVLITIGLQNRITYAYGIDVPVPVVVRSKA